MAVLLLFAALTGCAAHYPVNERLSVYSAERTERARTLRPRGSSDRLFVVATFSGGGTRAAAFAYGVLEELAAIEVQFDGKTRRLVDEVDVVSGVSGGSFAAAYFGLHGAKMFETFGPRFLYRDVQKALKWTVFAPRNWGKLGSNNFARSDLVADWFDRHLFDRATFADIAKKRGAAVMINATDLTRGAPFSFTADQFALICSNLGTVPIARAVVASAAVPVLFSPVSFSNYAGSCGYQMPQWVSEEIANTLRATRRSQRAEITASYLDSPTRPYVHLVDGGLTDNLGLRAILDEVVFSGGIRQTIERQRLGQTDHILFLVVNAQTGLNSTWDRLESGPSASQVLEAATTVQINRYNFETVELLRSSVEQWGRELRDYRCRAATESAANELAPGDTTGVTANSLPCRDVKLHLVEVSFDSVRDAQRRDALRSLPTSFALPSKAVDDLRTTARTLLRESGDFKEFLRTLALP